MQVIIIINLIYINLTDHSAHFFNPNALAFINT